MINDSVWLYWWLYVGVCTCLWCIYLYKFKVMFQYYTLVAYTQKLVDLRLTKSTPILCLCSLHSNTTTFLWSSVLLAAERSTLRLPWRGRKSRTSLLHLPSVLPQTWSLHYSLLILRGILRAVSYYKQCTSITISE